MKEITSYHDTSNEYLLLEINLKTADFSVATGLQTSLLKCIMHQVQISLSAILMIETRASLLSPKTS